MYFFIMVIDWMWILFNIGFKNLKYNLILVDVLWKFLIVDNVFLDYSD